MARGELASRQSALLPSLAAAAAAASAQQGWLGGKTGRQWGRAERGNCGGGQSEKRG